MHMDSLSSSAWKISPAVDLKNGIAHGQLQYEGICLSLHANPGADPVKVIPLGPFAARGRA